MAGVVMELDWESSSVEVLLNSRIPKEQSQRCHKLLSSSSSGLNAHVWVTTSGTSGRFKFVALSKEAILCSAKSVNNHIASDSSDIWLHALPDFHVGGLGIWARASLSLAKVIDYKRHSEKWDPSSFVQIARQAQASLTALVPTQVYDLVKKHLFAPPWMRAVIVGGGALTHWLYKKALLLGWKLLPSYGLTECSSQVATAYYGQFDKIEILSHVEVRINSKGIICVKSPSLLTTYAFIEGKEITFTDPKDGEWFRTEDKGQIEGKCLKIFGRGSHFVKVGGESVNIHHLQMVWEEITQSLDVSIDALLVAFQDGRLGQALYLVVKGVQTPLLKTAVQKYQKSVMPYERIRGYRFVKKIPRSSLGKVLFLNLE